MADPFLTDEQAAVLVRRSTRTIKQWRQDGRIRSFWMWDGGKRREVHKTHREQILATDKLMRERMFAGKRHAAR